MPEQDFTDKNYVTFGIIFSLLAGAIIGFAWNWRFRRQPEDNGEVKRKRCRESAHCWGCADYDFLEEGEKCTKGPHCPSCLESYSPGPYDQVPHLKPDDNIHNS